MKSMLFAPALVLVLALGGQALDKAVNSGRVCGSEIYLEGADPWVLCAADPGDLY